MTIQLQEQHNSVENLNNNSKNHWIVKITTENFFKKQKPRNNKNLKF